MFKPNNENAISVAFSGFEAKIMLKLSVERGFCCGRVWKWSIVCADVQL